MYGREIREAFAIAYARRGNATKALIQVLGKERASKMQPHTLRAKASALLNDYRAVAIIEQEKSAMLKRGDYLPRYRLRTYRADLGVGIPEANQQAKERKEKIEQGFQELKLLLMKLNDVFMERMALLAELRADYLKMKKRSPSKS
ncbi:hypothetical protein [Actinobacillus minor]|uniref:hypothetical protein n=1 Tax=Actinobacillus minor TaxID=51047 RepID=UPI0023F25EA9|nr:hypothetical protein [Actinobacillus minor]MDD6910425.1 hypothetical protein [Actinobacillus minor]MDY4714104.1 hypothetical protein [Actinobacillus minor]